MSTEDAFLSNIVIFTNAVLNHYGTSHKPIPTVTKSGLLMPAFTSNSYLQKMLEDSSILNFYKNTLVKGNTEPHIRNHMVSLIYQAEVAMGFTREITSSPASPECSPASPNYEMDDNDEIPILDITPEDLQDSLLDEDDNEYFSENNDAFSPPVSPSYAESQPLLPLLEDDEYFSESIDTNKLKPFKEFLETTYYGPLTEEISDADDESKPASTASKPASTSATQLTKIKTKPATKADTVIKVNATQTKRKETKKEHLRKERA